MPTPTSLPLSAVRFEGGVLGERVERIGTVTLLRQWEALNDRIPGAEPSHAVRNLRIAAGDIEGEFAGLCFQDSDVAKWLEAACYRLSFTSDPTLATAVEELVGLYERAQCEDGYLNPYHQLTPGAVRWSNLRDLHELYCAGHFVEAAVAHFEATGSTRLLAVARKLADLLVRTFGRGEGQCRGVPGHPEVELALVKLARASGDNRYLKLADYFVTERGQAPSYFIAEAQRRGEKVPPVWAYFDQQAYWQAGCPVTEQQEPQGHGVRAMYLYSAMADLARENGDEAMATSCRRLWDEMVAKHLYVIGGVGADGPGGENFSEAYDLPDDRSYAETCAAIGLMMWSRRMLDLDMDARYTQVMERALYNNVLAGLSQDACHYFYVNPLAVTPQETRRRYDCKMVKTQRVPWFGCACCPPNVARLLSSLAHYAVSRLVGGLAVHLFTSLRVEFAGWKLRMETDYPWQGLVRILIDEAPVGVSELRVRVATPGGKAAWALNSQPMAQTEDRGYLVIRRQWQAGDRLETEIPLPIQRVWAHRGVTSAAGRIALQRGPVIYAVEEIDHGPQLATLGVRRSAALRAEYEKNTWGGVVTLKGTADRVNEVDALYSEAAPGYVQVPLRAIPYAWWANRGEGEMRIWIRDYES
jgi:DUF1680 family protein